ncbi:MAG: D-aminoacyl-tRNA deacylase [Gemmatimonadota bacterium]
MRVVLQRVSRAAVRSGGRTLGEIGPGLALLVGFSARDDGATVAWMADKVSDLRVFADPEGKMNRSVDETGGEVLVVSQFTLYGDARKGRRPSFVQAAPPAVAIPLYEQFVACMERRLPGRVQTGEFGAEMQVELLGDGPVTLVLER